MGGGRVVAGSDPRAVAEALRVLRAGGLVCYPTDTVYGIGAAASDDGAVRRLFAVKGRAPDKPLPLLLADVSQAPLVAEMTPLAEALADRFWPGGLTIVMRKLASFDSPALAGGHTVALRVPAQDLVRRIVRALGGPITGTSANRAGAPPPVSASDVEEQMGEAVELIIDGGLCPAGVESTVIDITCEPPEILRGGAVSDEEVGEALGRASRLGGMTTWARGAPRAG